MEALRQNHMALVTTLVLQGTLGQSLPSAAEGDSTGRRATSIQFQENVASRIEMGIFGCLLVYVLVTLVRSYNSWMYVRLGHHTKILYS